jgi:sporulation protein YlmC with PRC-barrel domain
MLRTLAVCLAITGAAWGLVPLVAQSAEDVKSEGAKVVTTKVFRASTIMGMKVVNAQREDLGKIDELVIDVEKGTVRYVALSVGGVAGIGDKLFAIPFSAFQLRHAEDQTYFVLNVSKERLKAAPGFDKDRWPNVADPQWRDEIDKFYVERKVETTSIR